MKNKTKTWGMMLNFMPPKERTGISPNKKRCSAAAETDNGSMILCVRARVRERDHCFCAQKLGGLKEVSHIFEYINGATTTFWGI